MTAIPNHQPESPAILYDQLVERESNTTQKTVTLPINTKHGLMNQADTLMIESSQGRSVLIQVHPSGIYP